jgi:hypothetical protein
MASLAINIGDTNNGFLPGPDYIGGGHTSSGALELVGNVAGTPLVGNVSFGNGAMPYDPSNPMYGSLRIGSAQPVTGVASLFSGNVLIWILILWLIFRKKS